jgi:hypothetical protein
MSMPPHSDWRSIVGLLVAVGSACYLIAGEPCESALRRLSAQAARHLQHLSSHCHDHHHG